MTAVASFDVFDTLIIRTCGGSDAAFLATAQELAADGTVTVDPTVYVAARDRALQELTPDPSRHPTLAQVCDELAARLGLPIARAADLYAAELAVESRVCRAVPGATQRVAEARRRTGRGAIFVSDTPLPADFLERLLHREGLFLDGDALFVSCELDASKQHGGLFDLVAERLGEPAHEIAHVGDDRWSDVAHARLHGWTAQLDTTGSLTSRERALDRRSATTAGLGGRLAGAARTARLAERGRGATSEIAGSVALPLLAGFGLWVLRQAELVGLDRLYFVARDGEVFLDVTSRLAEQAGLEVECRYLYGSRRSWQLAARSTSTFDERGGVWLPDDIDGGDLTARSALDLVGLDPAAAYAVAPDPVLEPARADVPLGEVGWRSLQGLLSNGVLADEARRRAHDRRSLLLDYLDQEGVTGSGRVGLVDVGWTGRAARSVEDVLVDADRPLPAAHLFLGLLGAAPGLMGPDLFARSHGWLIDEARGRRSHAAPDDPVMIVETFAMGSEGSTTGLARDGGQVRPVLRSATNPATQAWDFTGYRRSLRDGLDALCDGPVLPRDVDLRPLAWEQVLGLWRRPTPAEAQAWGEQPYGEDFANARVDPLARPMTGKRVLAKLGVGLRWREPTYWLAGTVAITPRPWRQALTLARLVLAWRARLRRLPARLRAERALRGRGLDKTA